MGKTECNADSELPRSCIKSSPPCTLRPILEQPPFAFYLLNFAVDAKKKKAHKRPISLSSLKRSQEVSIIIVIRAWPTPERIQLLKQTLLHFLGPLHSWSSEDKRLLKPITVAGEAQLDWGCCNWVVSRQWEMCEKKSRHDLRLVVFIT